MDSLLVSSAILVLVVSVLGGWSIREDRRLRARAARFRQLELEGIDELGREDVYPEFAGDGLERVIEPDGTKTDARPLLRDEVAQLRERTNRTRKERHAGHHRQRA